MSGKDTVLSYAYSTKEGSRTKYLYYMYTSIGKIRVKAIDTDTLEGWAGKLGVSLEEVQKMAQN